MPLKDLRPNEKNPRSIKDGRFAELKRALAEDPEMLQARPVIALPDGTVIAGNMRLRAAEALGWEDIPTVVVELDAQRAQMWALRDNAAYGEWVEQDLAEILFELGQEGADLGLSGLDEKELTKLLDSVGGVGESADEVPDSPEEPVTAPGDLWVMGHHRLLCGDATSKQDRDTLMEGQNATLAFTDPPWGVAYEGGTKKRDALVGDDLDVTPLYAAVFDLLAEHGTDESGALLFCAAKNSLPPFLEARKAGWEIRAVIAWVKQQAQFGALGAQYKSKYEPILYCVRPAQPPKWRGPTNETNVWEPDPQPRVNDLHPTQKPVALAIRAIRNHSDVGDIVADPYLGSGSTLIGAEETGRRLYGLEIDPRYCDVAVQRWEDFTGQKAERA